jgi:hypothetical protein
MWNSHGIPRNFLGKTTEIAKTNKCQLNDITGIRSRVTPKIMYWLMYYDVLA